MGEQNLQVHTSLSISGDVWTPAVEEGEASERVSAERSSILRRHSDSCSRGRRSVRKDREYREQYPLPGLLSVSGTGFTIRIRDFPSNPIRYCDTILEACRRFATF